MSGEGEITIDDLKRHFIAKTPNSFRPDFVPPGSDIKVVGTGTRDVVKVQNLHERLGWYEENGFVVKKLTLNKADLRATGYPYSDDYIHEHLKVEAGMLLREFVKTKKRSPSIDELLLYVRENVPEFDKESILFDPDYGDEQIRLAIDEYRLENLAERAQKTYDFIKNWYKEKMPDLILDNIFLIEEVDKNEDTSTTDSNPLISESSAIYEVQKKVDVGVDLFVDAGGFSDESFANIIKRKWADNPEVVQRLKSDLYTFISLSKQMVDEKRLAIDLRGRGNLVINDKGVLIYLDTDVVFNETFLGKVANGEHFRVDDKPKMDVIFGQLEKLKKIADLL
ncbi:MAG: hypothetical protein WA057_06805 [Candidatus Magasanikiibacteriota bacterium]